MCDARSLLHPLLNWARFTLARADKRSCVAQRLWREYDWLVRGEIECPRRAGWSGARQEHKHRPSGARVGPARHCVRTSLERRRKRSAIRCRDRCLAHRAFCPLVRLPFLAPALALSIPGSYAPSKNENHNYRLLVVELAIPLPASHSSRAPAMYPIVASLARFFSLPFKLRGPSAAAPPWCHDRRCRRT